MCLKDYSSGQYRENLISRGGTENSIAGVCFWHSGIGTSAIGVYEDEYLEEQVKEINRRLGLL